MRITVALLLVAALVVWLVQPPQPLTANTLTSVFAAGQAMRNSVVIGREPHRIGILANAMVHN